MNNNINNLKMQQDKIFGSIAKIIGGLSSPVRIRLIHFLSQGPLTVEILATKIDQSIANTSMHLRKMLNEKIVTVSTLGQKRLYSLHPAMFIFWEASQNLAQELDPSLKFSFEDHTEKMDWDKDQQTTLKMIKNNEVILLDVRPQDEVSESIDGLNILHIPSTEIASRVSKLPKRKPVLVFCRGRLCALSAITVDELRSYGVKAFRYNLSWFSIKKLTQPS